MVQRKRGVAIIVLKCVIFGCCAIAQQTAFGTGMAIPPKSAIGGYVLLAQADTSSDPQTIIQETKNADAPAEPQAVMQEIKSATRLSSSKQRRRKPKMAGVPAVSQTVAQEAKEPVSQTVAQEAKEPESQSAAQEGEETDTLDKPLAVAQETKNAAAPAKPQAEAKAPNAGNVSKKRYGMAPIRWGISISETAGLERHSQTSHPANGPSISSESGGLVNTQTAEIQARTYVLQPYIAQLGGNIGVVSSKNHNINKVSGASGNRNNQLFGGGSLSLFPQSRFPFAMSFDVKDDSNSTDIQKQDTVTKRLNLDQTYRPMGSRSEYAGGYSRDTQVTSFNNFNNFSNFSILGGSSPNDTLTHSYWKGSYATTTPEHRINMMTKFNEKTTSLAQHAFIRADNFTVWDKYLPADSLLSLDSNVSINSTADPNSRARFLQVNTNANWQPESEDIPLFLDGGLRFFNMSNTTQGSATSSRSLGGNANARYIFSDNLTGVATGSVTRINSSGRQDLITTQRGNLTYTSHAIKVWENSSYSWNANGGASNQTGGASSQVVGISRQTAGGPDSSVFGGVGHGLSIPYTFNMFDKKFRMNSRINQSLGTNISRVDGRSYTIVNGGSVSLGSLLASTRPENEPLGGYGTTEGAINSTAVLSVNDRRVIGGKNPTQSRVYSLMLNLLGTSKTVYRGIEIEANMGTTHSAAGTELAGTGKATYRKSRVLDVRGLDYMGSLQLSTRSNSRVVDVNAQNPRFPWELDQRLRYKVGQNEMLLRGKIGDQYGVKNASLWLLFRAWRVIGN